MDDKTTTLDRLSTLALMNIYQKHLDDEELNTLFASGPDTAAVPDPQWVELIGELRQATRNAMPTGSDEARALAWRWIRLVMQMCRSDPQLATQLMKMQAGEPCPPQIAGMSAAMLEWIDAALMQARLALLAKYLTPEQAAELRQRQWVDANRRAWPALVLELRAHMAAGVDAKAAAVQAIVERWRQLFRDSFCGEDAVLEACIREALMHEADLHLGMGLDDALMAYLHQAQTVDNGLASPNAGPKPSAMLVAMQRAAHQLLDPPLVLDDPIALALLDSAEAHWLRTHLDSFRQPVSVGLRSAVVVRSRLADDIWTDALERGIDQYVILGAGLDTSAYRQPAAAGRIFEVDLPAVQQWKQARLQEAGIALPASLRFFPVDFERVSLAEGLACAGFNPNAPAIFSWLGVTMYLDKAAVEETLRVIAGCAKGSAVLMEYALPLHGQPPMMRIATEQLIMQITERGEPWKSFFEPAALIEMLTALGFTSCYAWTPDELNQRYLAHRCDGLRVGALSTRLVLASV